MVFKDGVLWINGLRRRGSGHLAYMPVNLTTVFEVAFQILMEVATLAALTFILGTSWQRDLRIVFIAFFSRWIGRGRAHCVS